MEFKHETIMPNEDINVMFLNNVDTTTVIPKHWHNHIEIIYILDGHLDIEINNSLFQLEKDQLIVISPREIHSTSTKTGNKAILLQIPYDILETNLPDVKNLHFECNPYMKDSEEINEQNNIKNILKIFSQIYKEKPLGYKLKLNSLTFDLLFILVNKFSISLSQLKVKKTDRYLDRLELIIKYVKKHYMEDISLDDISSEAGLNPEYFSRFFKKYMGTTFLKYLNSIRLQHFYTDLTNSDCSITKLIEKNGFTNYKMFMKLFKDIYVYTPSEIRKLIIEINNRNAKR